MKNAIRRSAKDIKNQPQSTGRIVRGKMRNLVDGFGLVRWRKPGIIPVILLDNGDRR